MKVIGSRLIADKGYINKACKKELKKSHSIKLIYPVRKNQNVEFSMKTRILHLN